METAPMTASPLGRRERKKHDTRRMLRHAALTLAIEHGVEAVTVEQITDAADVSERTFFNHFERKEDALLPETEMVSSELREAILSRPADEPALQTLRFAIGQSQLVRDAHLHRDRALARQRLIHDDPGLLARHLAQAHDFETSLVGVPARTMIGAHSCWPRYSAASCALHYVNGPATGAASTT